MRKIELTPLQNRIVWILEEAGEENLETVRTTLRAEGEHDEPAFRAALDGLKGLGFVSVTDSSAILTTSGYAALTR
jgi:hypothetical protein